MGYLGRRIGLSQDNGDSNPGAAGGAVGGGLLDLFAHGYFERQGDIYNAPGIVTPEGMTATGGIISDYVSGSDVYRSHIFTSSGALNVSALSTSLPNSVDYLCVAGGGGNQSSPAGSNRESGSGAGGLLSSHPDVPATFKQTQVTISSTGNINIVVGAGAGGKVQGSPSSIDFSSPVSTVGGGHGANLDNNIGGPGGSGGGNWYSGATPAQGTNYPGPTQQGYPGGIWGGTNNWTGGAGGGAGAQGANGGTSRSAGRTISITGSAVEYSRGGASNSYPSTPRSENGSFNTGDGASGVGHGGSGIVVVRYQIGQVTATAKATGGAISFHGGKTIHTFTNSGTFANPTALNGGSSNPLSVEYVVIGGGAGAASGGGGAGGYTTGSSTVASASSSTITVGGGGRGIGGPNTTRGESGTNTTAAFPAGTITAGYGAGGGYDANPSGSGKKGNDAPLGSGGGGAWGSGGQPAPSGGSQGNNGGNGIPTNTGNHAAGGGGGAGGVGGSGTNPGSGGAGGIGIQAPSTFHDPLSTVGAPGPGGGKYWFAGGGGGVDFDPGSNPGGGTGGPYAGGGGSIANGNDPNSFSPTCHALENTGGGGGGNYAVDFPRRAGNGGSGIVLIAYPS